MTQIGTHGLGTIVSGVKTISDPATPEALTDDAQVAHVVDVQAHSSNTQSVTIGALDSVVHGTTTQSGIKIAPGAVWTCYDVRLSDIYIDVQVADEGVGYTASVR